MPDPVLVVIFLRGGADALALVGPTADPDYAAARPPDLRVLREGDGAGHRLSEGLADLDFRLHPQAGELAELFHAGDLSILHATGLREATRSHFEAEALIETAEGPGGWLARWLDTAGPGGPLPALAVGTALPESLRGARAAAAEAMADLMLAQGYWLRPQLQARLAAGVGDHPLLDATVADMLALSDAIERRFRQAGSEEMPPYVPATPYPDGPLSAPLMTVAQAIKAGLGLRVATVDYGGWDTHVNQAGQFAFLTAGLSSALMAFWRDLGPLQQDVAVVVQSEFGRRLRANASGGTDHGRAGLMMVLGPQARGGRLIGDWPGLGNGALEDGADLAVTTDYRAVLAEVLEGHMGPADRARVFPGLGEGGVGLYG
jgi:uncharacterized protein (DUF1501 family)